MLFRSLEGEPSAKITLRTRPRYADWVSLGDDRSREPPEQSRISVLAAPGTYTVTLVVDSQDVGTQQLEIRKDPHSEGTLADIQAQTAMGKDIRKDMDTAAEMINQIEWVRRQTYDLKAVLKDQRADEEILAAADSLDDKLIAVEETLLQLKVTGTGQDNVRWPQAIVGKLAYLADAVATADFPPADQHREVHQLLKRRLEDTKQAFDGVMETALPAFNRM